jgi:hypothetical protein
VGPEKGAIIERLVAAAAPAAALELGTFLGYSAIRIARSMPAGGRLVCVEANPGNAAVARTLLARAGLAGKVEVVEGRTDEVLGEAARRLGGPAGLVFEDHCKQCYLPDLQRMEALGVVVPGTQVVADNVVYPGAPGFLEVRPLAGGGGAGWWWWCRVVALPVVVVQGVCSAAAQAICGAQLLTASAPAAAVRGHVGGPLQHGAHPRSVRVRAGVEPVLGAPRGRAVAVHLQGRAGAAAGGGAGLGLVGMVLARWRSLRACRLQRMVPGRHGEQCLGIGAWRC